jgi:hypothetical protein
MLINCVNFCSGMAKQNAVDGLLSALRRDAKGFHPRRPVAPIQINRAPVVHTWPKPPAMKTDPRTLAAEHVAPAATRTVQAAPAVLHPIVAARPPFHAIAQTNMAPISRVAVPAAKPILHTVVAHVAAPHIAPAAPHVVAAPARAAPVARRAVHVPRPAQKAAHLHASVAQHHAPASAAVKAQPQQPVEWMQTSAQSQSSPATLPSSVIEQAYLRASRLAQSIHKQHRAAAARKIKIITQKPAAEATVESSVGQSALRHTSHSLSRLAQALESPSFHPTKSTLENIANELAVVSSSLAQGARK